MTIEDLIKLRRKLGVSQETLADRMQCAVNTVSRMEGVPLERATIGRVKEYLAALGYTLDTRFKNAERRARKTSK